MKSQRSVRRVNYKAIVATVLGIVVVLGGGFLAAGVLRGQVRKAALDQVKSLEYEKKYDLALRHLDQYLEKHPQDLEVLKEQARLLFETARNYPQRERAASVNDRVLRLNPEGPEAQELRLRLADLYIKISDELSMAAERDEKGAITATDVVKRLRYSSARELLDERMANGAEDGKTDRLMAMALEGLWKSGNRSLDLGGGNRLDETDIIDTYYKALKKDPTDREASLRLALFTARGKQTPDVSIANGYVEGMLEAAPESSDAWLTARDYYVATNQPEKAVAALEKAESLDPDDFQVLLSRAGDLLRQGQYDQVGAVLDRIPEKQRRNPSIGLYRGLAHQAAGDREKAIDVWRKTLIETQTGDLQILWQLANALLESGRITDARSVLSEIQRVGGDAYSSVATILEGMILEKEGDLSGAVVKLRSKVNEVDRYFRPQAFLALARCSNELGKRGDAEYYFNEVLKLNPDSADARFALAEFRRQDGDLSQAVATLRPTKSMEAGSEQKDNPDLLYYFCQMLLREVAQQPAGQRDWREFDRSVAELRELQTDSPKASLLEIQKLLVEGRVQDAVTQAKSAVETWPKSMELWANLADAQIRLGQREEALATLEASTASDKVGDKAQFRIARAEVLTSLGKGREALDLLGSNLDSMPLEERVQVIAARGRMLAARGNLGEAMRTFVEWERLQPGKPEPMLAQLDLALTIGNNTVAQQVLAKLKPARDQSTLMYDLARAEYLIRMPAAGPEAQRLSEARKILEDVTRQNPSLGTAAFLLGRVLELQKDEDRAIRTYQNAVKLGNSPAMGPLFRLLARADRFDDMDTLIKLTRKSNSTFSTSSPERLAAEVCVLGGKPEGAERFLNLTVQNYGSSSPAVKAWQLTMLDRLGRSDEVENRLRRELERPDRTPNLPAWIALIRHQAARGSKEEAKKTVRELTGRVNAESRALLEAQCLAAIGETEQAEAAYKAAMEGAPNAIEAKIATAMFYEETKRPELAEPILRSILEADPNNRPAIRFLALILSSDPDLTESGWNDAMALLGTETDEATAETGQDRLTRAIVLARHPNDSKRNEAIPILEGVVADQPAATVLATAARETLAKLYLATNRPDRAAEVAAVTASSSPNAVGIVLYVESLLRAENWNEADRQIERLANLAPADANVALLRVRLAEGRAEPGKEVEALLTAYRDRAEQDGSSTLGIAVAQRLLKLEPPRIEEATRLAEELAKRDPAMAWLAAQILSNSGDRTRAVDYAATVLDQGSPAQIFEAAKALLTVAQLENGKGPLVDRIDSLLAEAVSKNEDLSGLNSIVAMLRHMQGQYEEEVRIYQELLASDPKNALLNNNAAWAISETVQKPEEALPLIDLAIQIAGRLPELLDTRGVILTRLQRYPEAIAELREAISGRESGMYCFHLARALKLANQPEEARVMMRRAQELGLTVQDVEVFERTDFEELAKL